MRFKEPKVGKSQKKKKFLYFLYTKNIKYKYINILFLLEFLYVLLAKLQLGC